MESDTPSDYQWSDIKGEQGVPGEKGADGTQYYTWVAYSDNADGNPMYQQPTASTKYIGIAVNKTTQQEGADPKEYTWSLFRGADGEGFTVHGQWHSGMTVPKNGVVSMGGGSYVAKVATTNPPLWTLTDPQGNRLTDKQGYYLLTGEVNTAEYDTWAEAGEPGKDGADGKPGADGQDGQDGKDGKDGVGVDSIQEFYLISDQKTGVTPYTPGWSLSVPTPTKQQRYLWNYECVIYTDGTYLNTAAAIIGMYSEDGRGIKSVTEYYARSTSATQAPTQWGTTPPTLDSTYRYLWNYEVVTYTDDSTSQTQPVMIGAYGDKGDKGDDGRPGLQGLQGCVVRTSEWAAGVEYRNDSQLDTPAVRYIDVVLVRNDLNDTGWDAYQCLQTHTSSSTLTYANTQYWKKFGTNVGAIFTSLIIAKNAKIRFLQGNQLLIQKSDGTITAGISGGSEGGNTRIWAGSQQPGTAPFRVDEQGNLFATNAEISGIIHSELTYSSVKRIVDLSTYTIDPAKDAFNTLFIASTRGTWVYLPDANTYNGLELNIYQSAITTMALTNVYIATRNSSQKIYCSTSTAYINGTVVQTIVQGIPMIATNFKLIPNVLVRIIAVEGNWYVLSGALTGE